MDQCQPRPNRETQPLWVQGIWLVPNGHTLAGFTIGAFHLATMATLHLRALRKTKNLFLQKDFYLLPTQAKKPPFITTWYSWRPC
jgi:hypothetical protein